MLRSDAIHNRLQVPSRGNLVKKRVGTYNSTPLPLSDEGCFSMSVPSPDSPSSVRSLALAAREAWRVLRNAETDVKNAALRHAAAALRAETAHLLEVNRKELEDAPDLSEAYKDRLRLNEARLESMAVSLEEVAALPDPVGRVTADWTAPRNRLHITRVAVPLGVIGVIYESRPNVTVDAAALCLKAGNACVLRPGHESLRSALALLEPIRAGLRAAGLPEDAVQVVPTSDRAAVGEMLASPDLFDVIVPRGGPSLVARVYEESRVPILAHLTGNCHTYVHKDADRPMARRIVLNAKMRRTGICGATETLLVDRDCAETHLGPLVRDLLEAGCEVRGDAETQGVDPRVKPATEEDWATEYLDAIIAVKVVTGLHEAIAHIERYGSHHTDSIVTENAEAAATFLREVDSAIVAHNASTQFADGGEFGMGAEIGIATGRLHARGPVGTEQLTTFKYVVHGTGQVRRW